MKHILTFVEHIIDAFQYKTTQRYNLRTFRTTGRPKGKSFRSVKIPHDARVLDIGSGDEPSFRADVLLEKYIQDMGYHRGGRSLQHDERPLIIGDAQDLPFLSASFGYIVCRHVLEHIEYPLKLAKEFNRVSTSGYIETPAPFTELIHGGYPNQENLLESFNVKGLFHGWGMREAHKWFVISDGLTIFMLPKTEDGFLVYLIFGYFIKNNTGCNITSFLRKNRNWYATQHEWSQSNPLNIRLLREYDINDLAEEVNIRYLMTQLLKLPLSSKKHYCKNQLYTILRKHFYRTRKDFSSVYDILACPVCKSKLERRHDFLFCNNCGKYPIVNEIPVLLREALSS